MSMQKTLWPDIRREEIPPENPAYLREQLLTYLGNKRSLLPLLEEGLGIVKRRLGKRRLSILDAFAGSGVVSRFFKKHASRLVSNDFEEYAAIVGRCYLANQSEINLEEIVDRIHSINEGVTESLCTSGFFRRLYAPADENDIQQNDRVFYTVDNACRLDTYRQLIASQPSHVQDFLLGPLLSAASVHANTSGVFKGFYKDSATGIGCYGGGKGDALTRIKGRIELRPPILSNFDSDVEVKQEDTNELVKDSEHFDLAYFDPPYNQHPYGSNYFMLNLLVRYQEPMALSEVSGIPKDWRRSRYNKRKDAAQALEAALNDCKARFLMISYNDEGFVDRERFDSMLSDLGSVEVIEKQYNVFRGCRNLRNRKPHVTEQLFIVEKP